MPYPKDINKLKKKLDLYNGIVKANSKNTFALKKRMEVRFLLGDTEGALEDLTELILLDPENKNLKNHPFNPHRPDAEPIDPNYAGLFVTLGLIKMKTKSYSEALAAYEKAILIGATGEDLIISYTDASFCGLELMDWEKAYLFASRALGINDIQSHKSLKNNLEYYQAYAFVSKTVKKQSVLETNSLEYRLLNKYTGVFLSYFNEETLEDKAGWSRNFILAALAYEKLNKHELFLETIAKSLSLYESAGAYVTRAMFLLSKGDNEKFVQDLKLAYSLNPQWVESLFPNIDFEAELTNKQKQQLMETNIPMQILDKGIDIGGNR